MLRHHNFEEAYFSEHKHTSKKVNQPKLNEINKVQVVMSKEILIDACVELVTLNGRPFTLMIDSGFRKILEPILEGLPKKNNISPTNESIQNYIHTEYNIMKSKIIRQITGVMICLKVDAVTRLDRSFLGINIQYWY